jgi:hypothetical protein
MQSKATGTVKFEVLAGDTVIKTEIYPNMLMPSFYTHLAQTFGGNNNFSPSHIGFGTDGTPPNAVNAGLTNGILVPIQLIVYPAQNALEFSATLQEMQGNGITFREFGLFAGNVLLARRVHAGITKQSNHRFRITWLITFN